MSTDLAYLPAPLDPGSHDVSDNSLPVGLEDRSGSAPYQKWGESLDAGFQILPDVLLKNQHKLGLSATDLVVLINLTMQWWYRERLPFPKSATIAKRMGASVRTVQRSLNRLEKLALVGKVPLDQRRAFDPSALVERLIVIAQHDPAFQPRLRAPDGGREVQALPSA
jgi:hypothetical protein